MRGYGLDELHSKIPELKQPAVALLAALIPIVTFIAATLILTALDRLWPNWTLANQIAVMALAFLTIAPFFWRHEAYTRRWGDKAYRNAFALHVLTGLPGVFAVIVHIAFMPGERVISGSWEIPAEIAAWYFCLTGAVLDVRAILAFGFDNLSMLYVYYPQEGRLVESKIYAVIRHPVYSAVLRLGWALALWRGTWPALAFAAFMPLGLTLWLRLAEERELVQRFGESYADHRRRVPAFFPQPKNIVKFWKFLLTGS
ncbi:MAG: methyltransferase [Chloroflexota bacterium]